MKPWILALCAVLAAPLAHAKLVFDSVNIGVSADPKLTEKKIEFPFHCEGEAVLISEVEASCGCISGEVDKRDLQPGDKGVVTATFKLGSFEGEVIKTIVVRSNDREDASRQLTARITIPKLLEISPEVTTWTVGDEPKPKTVSVKVIDEKPIEVTEIICGRDSFTAELKVVEKGRRYEVVLTPKTTETPVLGALTIKTNSDVPRYQSRMSFFNVTRQRAQPAGVKPGPVPTPPPSKP